MNQFVESNYERKKNDNYQTVDVRCTDALLGYFHIEAAVDVCSPEGSGILDRMVSLGIVAYSMNNYYDNMPIDNAWVVTNPPYKRGLVDDVVRHQIQRVKFGECAGAALLLRSYFDHAKSRADMFDSPLYYGQIRLRFRPWWSDERKASPIHNFVWHIWARKTFDYPIVLYSEDEK